MAPSRRHWLKAAVRLGCLLLIVVPICMRYADTRDRNHMRETTAYLRSISQALESRATDTNSYPVTHDMETIRRLLEPKYFRDLPIRDGWGHPFRYSCFTDLRGICEGYVFASAGSDGRFMLVTERLLIATSISSSEKALHDLHLELEAETGASSISCSQVLARDVVYANGQLLLDTSSCRARSPILTLCILAGFATMMVMELVVHRTGA